MEKMLKEKLSLKLKFSILLKIVFLNYLLLYKNYFGALLLN